MTLEEAIKHCEEVAETQEENCKYAGHDHYTKLEASACATEHRQLAEWLKELKERRTNTGDTISRKAAIDALCSACGNDCDKSEFVYDAPQDEQVILCPEHYALTSLPSAQPEIIRCKNCEHWKNEHLCERLSRFGSFETKADFYCGYPERKTDD